MPEGYDRNKDNVIHKGLVKAEKRLINVEVYSYDGGAKKLRLAPVGKNTNPNADPNKKWIKQKAISALSFEEATQLVTEIKNALPHLK